MTLHDLISLMILPIGTSRTNEIQYIKYTSEYILKLQIYRQKCNVLDLFSQVWLRSKISHNPRKIYMQAYLSNGYLHPLSNFNSEKVN